MIIKTYKDFLNESAAKYTYKKVTQDQLKDYKFDHNINNNPVYLYRMLSDVDGNIIYADPSLQERRAIHTDGFLLQNLHNCIIDNSDYWKDFPKVSKCIPTQAGTFRNLDYYGDSLWRVVPLSIKTFKAVGWPTNNKITFKYADRITGMLFGMIGIINFFLWLLYYFKIKEEWFLSTDRAQTIFSEKIWIYNETYVEITNILDSKMSDMNSFYNFMTKRLDREYLRDMPARLVDYLTLGRNDDILEYFKEVVLEKKTIRNINDFFGYILSPENNDITLLEGEEGYKSLANPYSKPTSKFYMKEVDVAVPSMMFKIEHEDLKKYPA